MSENLRNPSTRQFLEDEARRKAQELGLEQGPHLPSMRTLRNPRL
jgi:hypothetical protein